MIAFDTNVLLRVLVDDDPSQAIAARALVERCLDNDEACFLSDVVIAETVWVLEEVYALQRREISATLRRAASARPFVFESRSRVLAALDRFDAGMADFSDYLLLRRGLDEGARALYSFDRKLQREPEVREP